MSARIKRIPPPPCGAQDSIPLMRSGIPAYHAPMQKKRAGAMGAGTKESRRGTAPNPSACANPWSSQNPERDTDVRQTESAWFVKTRRVNFPHLLSFPRKRESRIICFPAFVGMTLSCQFGIWRLSFGVSRSSAPFVYLLLGLHNIQEVSPASYTACICAFTSAIS